MILTYPEIMQKCLVEGEVAAKQRQLTSYDATVCNIICDGLDWKRKKFLLKPRGLVWIKSSERFKLPNNITALATLKTTWTHKGILALNVGLVDPGWEGPLSTVIVNFSKVDFPLHLGEPFFRLMFIEHKPTNAQSINKSHKDYLLSTLDNSVKFSDTFLTMDTLSGEISQEIFKTPSWAPKLAFFALIFTILAIFAPLAVNVFQSTQRTEVMVEQLGKEVEALCADSSRC